MTWKLPRIQTCWMRGEPATRGTGRRPHQVHDGWGRRAGGFRCSPVDGAATSHGLTAHGQQQTAQRVRGWIHTYAGVQPHPSLTPVRPGG